MSLAGSAHGGQCPHERGKRMQTDAPKIASPDDVNLLERSQLRCPWPSYAMLREEARDARGAGLAGRDPSTVRPFDNTVRCEIALTTS